MLRLLLGSALPVLGVGLAAAFVGPSLVGTSTGEAIVVSGAGPAAVFQPASFDGPACASTLLLEEGHAAADLHIVALAINAGPQGLVVEAHEVPAGTPVEEATLVLLVDHAGRVVAAAEPAAYLAAFGAGSEHCDPDSPTQPAPGAV